MSEADIQSGALWLAHMRAGEFELAWRQSDTIHRRGAPDPHRFWRGQPIAGKRVMLRCLHGFGDAVMFLRYLPRLRALAAELIVEVAPRFVALARCFDGVGQVITWGDDAPPEPPKWDVQIEIMELPYFFRTQACELPLATRYVRPPPREPLAGTGPRVGLAWSAGEWNSERAIPFSTLEPLLDVEGCTFWSLRQDRATDARLRQDETCRTSVAGLAATIAQLDLVITTDSLAAHLAGAMGVRAWVLLLHQADWRWMERREDSPWYPSLRLFRQPRPGDWAAVVERVRHELRATA